MSADYPSSDFGWTDRVDGVDDVMADDVNSLAAEIDAIESDLVGTGVSGGLKQAAASFNENWRSQHSTSGEHLGNAISVVQLSNEGIADNDTDTLTFDFVPSKIVIAFSGRGKTDSTDDAHGHTTGHCVITITGPDTFTSVMNACAIFWDSRTAVKYPLSNNWVSSNANIVYCRVGNDSSANDAFFVATATWSTANKQLTLTWQETQTTPASNFVELVATAYR